MALFGQLGKIEPLSDASLGSRRDRTSTVTAGDCIIAIAGSRLARYSVKKCAASSMLIENIAATDALATCCPALSIFAYLAKLEQQNRQRELGSQFREKMVTATARVRSFSPFFRKV